MKAYQQYKKFCYTNSETGDLYSVTPKPDRQTFVNNEKVNKKYQFLMVRFSKVVHPTRYSEI